MGVRNTKLKEKDTDILKDEEAATLQAAEWGRFDVAHFLLDNGARPDVGNNECVAPIDLAARPFDDYDVPIAPDMGLLCRMIRESGALIVLANKMVSAALEKTRRRRADAMGTVDSVEAKHFCVDAHQTPDAFALRATAT